MQGVGGGFVACHVAFRCIAASHSQRPIALVVPQCVGLISSILWRARAEYSALQEYLSSVSTPGTGDTRLLRTIQPMANDFHFECTQKNKLCAICLDVKDIFGICGMWCWCWWWWCVLCAIDKMPVDIRHIVVVAVMWCCNICHCLKQQELTLPQLKHGSCCAALLVASETIYSSCSIHVNMLSKQFNRFNTLVLQGRRAPMIVALISLLPHVVHELLDWGAAGKGGHPFARCANEQRFIILLCWHNYDPFGN